MKPNEIRAELMKKGVYISDIARKLEVTRSNVSVVVSGKRPNPKVRAAIAEELGLSVSEIWPEQAEEEAA